MKSSSKFIVLTAALGTLAVATHAGLFNQLKAAAAANTNSAVASVAELSPDQLVGGLKEALGKGVERAVASLGRDGGFLTNLSVKIPTPEKLKGAEKVLRAAGQGPLVDDFIGTMNHAAEKAVPVAAAVFGDAIRQMSIEDAKGLLSGTNDSATQFFRRTTQTNLHAQFYPIVQKATDAVGVTAAYKQMMGKVAVSDSLGGLFGKKSPVKLDAADLDAYVTDKALDGLFKMVAEEEKNIRANPVARTSELLKKVFGAATKP